MDREQLDADTLAAIAELNMLTTTRTQVSDQGDTTTTAVSSKVKMHPKLKALDALARMLGLLNDEGEEGEDKSGGLASLLKDRQNDGPVR